MANQTTPAIQIKDSNVGIGTVSPANKLSISSGGFDNGATVVSVLNTSSTQKSHVVYDTFLIQQDDAPTLRLYETLENLSTTISSDGGLTSFATTGEMGLFVAGSSTAPGWTGLNGVQAIRIKSNGNVGIGTTSPAQRLQLIGNIGVGNGTYNGGVYANSSTSAVDTNWGFDFLYNAGQSDYSTRIKYYPTTGENRKGGIWNSLSNAWVLYGDSNNTPNVIIPSGNVGIGTTTPDAYPYGGKLNVNGSISSSGGKIGFGVTDAFTLNGIDTAHYGMSSNMNLVQLSGYYGLVFATTGAERMRITDGGNLGVGTTSPLYKTTIYNGPTNTDVLCLSNDQIQGSFTQNFVGISLQDQYANGGGNVSVIRSYSNLYQQWGSALVFGTTGNTGNGVIERMVINPEGNVGINTSIFSPTEKLEVNGNINISPPSFTPGFLSFYNDLAGQPPFITNFSGVRWGYKNGDPGFPPVATDMSIINNPSLAGYFGSIMSFKIQPYVVPGPSFTDSQVDKLNLVPYNFFTGTGGVGINTISPQASLHVYENRGFPPPYRSDYRAAKFEWDFGGVVFPNVPEDNKNMIPGEPGMVIFNTTVAKLQVFDGTNWVNLH